MCHCTQYGCTGDTQECLSGECYNETSPGGCPFITHHWCCLSDQDVMSLYYTVITSGVFVLLLHTHNWCCLCPFVTHSSLVLSLSLCYTLTTSVVFVPLLHTHH